MSKRINYLVMPLLAVPAVTMADVPSVAVDIPPIYSLVDRVMGELGSPDLIIQQGATPHRYSMRPSEADSLDRADAVFWVSESLTPWLVDAMEALADDAVSVELMGTPDTLALEYRQGATFEQHDHGHEHAQNNQEHEHGHNHDHGAADKHEHDHGHNHAGMDPHGWLDPANAQTWLDTIAESLARIDPENAAIYQQNAQLGKADLDALINELDAQLDGARDARFIVFHDAYQYFEHRFNLSAAGAISLGDASDPSPARINELQGLVNELNIDCVFSEPQFNPALVESVFSGTGVNTSIVVDPLGIDLPLGSELYPALLTQLADGLTQCAEGA
ncbi:MAG: zinc ABC transporter substrate-binding protein [Pseudomonadota bacterium]